MTSTPPGREGAEPRHRSDVEVLTARWWAVLLLGLLGIAAGVIVLAWPGISVVTLAWVTGIFLVIDGVLELAAALAPRREDGMLALRGALCLIAGLILIRHPFHGALVIALLLGIWFVVFGVVRVAEALGRSERHRVWDLGIGVVEVAAGLIMVSDARIGVTALAVVVGVSFVLRGVLTAAVGWILRVAHRVP